MDGRKPERANLQEHVKIFFVSEENPSLQQIFIQAVYSSSNSSVLEEGEGEGWKGIRVRERKECVYELRPSPSLNIDMRPDESNL